MLAWSETVAPNFLSKNELSDRSPENLVRSADAARRLSKMLKYCAVPPQFSATHAIFLDFDGTLVDTAKVPDGVVMPPELRSLLTEISGNLSGALCIVTGRKLEDINRYLGNSCIDIAAEHGAVMRLGGVTIRDKNKLPLCWESLLSHAEESMPGLVVERKNNSVALHYRLNPRLEEDLDKLAHQLCARGGRGHKVFRSDSRIEIKRRDAHKGNAIRRVLKSPQYANRVPIFVGDSEFDVPGLVEVRKIGGISMSVKGSFSNSTEEVRKWLSSYAAEAAMDC